MQKQPCNLNFIYQYSASGEPILSSGPLPTLGFLSEMPHPTLHIKGQRKSGVGIGPTEWGPSNRAHSGLHSTPLLAVREQVQIQQFWYIETEKLKSYILALAGVTQ